MRSSCVPCLFLSEPGTHGKAPPGESSNLFHRLGRLGHPTSEYMPHVHHLGDLAMGDIDPCRPGVMRE